MRGASPDSSQEAETDNQMGNETKHMESDDHSESCSTSADGLSKSGTRNSSATSGGSSLKSTSDLSTKIAVDWLNNLLFVLDKYRLVVIDFDGNNELVLIDDFTVNNRPINIKLDPINDFLYWLQAGTYYNTIYKLDLNVLPLHRATEKILDSGKLSSDMQVGTAALISHHYAHPIITKLPKQSKLFTIDHKHSKIYVPFELSPSNPGRLDRDEAEIFTNDTSMVTHLNSTSDKIVDSHDIADTTEIGNSTFSTELITSTQILAFNLDGTDQGPYRGLNENGYIATVAGIDDITIDTEEGLLYWLSDGGKYLNEEPKLETSSSQHELDGKGYKKLIHFNLDANQPTDVKSRSNMRKLISILSPIIATNRSIRSGEQGLLEPNGLASTLSDRQRHDHDYYASGHDTSYLTLGIVCLVVLSIYLIYAFVFQHIERHSTHGNMSERNGSITGSSINISQIDSNNQSNGFIASSTISRWIVGSSQPGSSNFNPDLRGSNNRLESDIESVPYDTTNDVDKHYREDTYTQEDSYIMNTNQLANLSGWPTNLNDLSNKLYVPVEVLRDEALSSIHRISMDKLEIERRAALGEGHFGTVLQGTITCTSREKSVLFNKSQTLTSEHQTSAQWVDVQQGKQTVISSVSSGHGSSSTSSEFVSANSCIEPGNGEYLVPKSQCNSSTMSDYLVENSAFARSDNSPNYNKNSIGLSSEDEQPNEDDEFKTNTQIKLKVAIKKLKENASAEEKRDFLQEAKLLANFDHPNIVQLLGICLDRGATLIVMELMLGGDLIRYMQENTPKSNCFDNLTEDDLLSICMDIVNGCCYLEELNYIHRDIAARNCLVSSRKKEERVVKLADFGLARDIYKDSYYKKLNDSAMPLKWMAPECLTEQKFTTMSDVWSFGVVMWEVMSFCQEKPYSNVEPFFMKDHLAGGYRLRKPEDCDDNIYRLMTECWQFEPRNRPTFQECRAILIEIKNGKC